MNALLLPESIKIFWLIHYCHSAMIIPLPLVTNNEDPLYLGVCSV